jgi:short chain dehydrogenase
VSGQSASPASVPSLLALISGPADVHSEDERVERLLRLEEILDAAWMRLFEVNVLSGVRLTRKYLPGMMKKNWGRVIFISSERGQHIPAEIIPSALPRPPRWPSRAASRNPWPKLVSPVNSVLAGPTATALSGEYSFVDDTLGPRRVLLPFLERRVLTQSRSAARFQSRFNSAGRHKRHLRGGSFHKVRQLPRARAQVRVSDSMKRSRGWVRDRR